jgi:hypothetical protein
LARRDPDATRSCWPCSRRLPSTCSTTWSSCATVYQRDDATGEVVVEDGPDGYWSRPPAFESGGGGLVSTASDYLAFASALPAGDRCPGGVV